MRICCILILFLATTFNGFALTTQQEGAILRNHLWKKFINLPKEERPKVGVALSAGGVRGFAHVGVLEVFDNAKLPIDMITGTSMGSVVGGLYSAGVSTSKLWQISTHLTMNKITPDYNAIGLFRLLFARKLPSSSNLVKFFHEQIGDMQFENTKIPFACPAMDVKTGEKVLFNSGPLAIAVRASMNLPGVFEPVSYRHRQLVDGAVVDYLPVDTLKNMGAEYIIASVTPLDFFSKTPNSIAAYLIRIGDVRGAAMIEEAAAKANFVITNRVLDIGTLELDKLHKAGEVGLTQAYTHLNELQEDLLLFYLSYEHKN